MATASIKSSGGDYTSLSSWEAALSANPSSTEIASIDEAFDAGEVTINVGNSNRVELKITVGSGYRFTDSSSWPSMAGVETDCGRINATTVDCVAASTNNVIIEWLMANVTSDYGGLIYGGVTNQQGHIIRHCIVNQAGGIYSQAILIRRADSSESPECTVHHTAIYNWDASTDGVIRTRGGSVMDCAHVSIHTGADAGFKCGDSSDTINCYNCISIGATSKDFDPNAGTIGGDYNVSGDTSSSIFTNNDQSVSATTVFTNVTSGSEDLHMPSGADGSYEGDNVTATYGSVDIDGETISDHDIGCDEYVAAGGNPKGIFGMALDGPLRRNVY